MRVLGRTGCYACAYVSLLTPGQIITHAHWHCSNTWLLSFGVDKEPRECEGTKTMGDGGGRWRWRVKSIGYQYPSDKKEKYWITDTATLRLCNNTVNVGRSSFVIRRGRDSGFRFGSLFFGAVKWQKQNDYLSAAHIAYSTFGDKRENKRQEKQNSREYLAIWVRGTEPCGTQYTAFPIFRFFLLPPSKFSQLICVQVYVGRRCVCLRVQA